MDWAWRELESGIMHRFLLHNDAIRPTAEPCLSPGQVGFMNGWGVFSTLRVAEGVQFAFEKHWARMQRDAERMHVPFPGDPLELRAALDKLITANEAYNATLRVAVVRNHGGPFEAPGCDRPFELIAFTTDLKDWGRSVRLTVKADARHGAAEFRGAKITAWANNLTWSEQAHQKGFDEVILLDEEGRVSECTSANIFAQFGKRFVTPPLASGCLPGITREILLELDPADQFTIEEQHLGLHQLQDADAVFITSSTRDLLGVAEVEGLQIQQNWDGLERLQRRFSQYRDDYVARQAHLRVG